MKHSKLFGGVVLSLLHLTLVSARKWEGDIVFEDNFDGTRLNESKWEIYDSCNVFSHQWQCYTRDNIAVRGGKLVFTARWEQKKNKNCTSGRIRQIENETYFPYGTYVVRARLARGDQLFPGIWMMPPVRSRCRWEEIDIAEFRGQLPHQIGSALHWGKNETVRLVWKNNTLVRPFDFTKDFHEFAINWDPSKIEWFLDNEAEPYFSVSLNDKAFEDCVNNATRRPCGDPTPYVEPSNFILNLAVGGNYFKNYPEFDLATWTKPTMEIDWVRVYQQMAG